MPIQDSFGLFLFELKYVAMDGREAIYCLCYRLPLLSSHFLHVVNKLLPYRHQPYATHDSVFIDTKKRRTIPQSHQAGT